MDRDELSEIGFVVRTHGVKGQVRINFNENIKELPQKGALFLSATGNYLPYFIQQIKYISETEALVTFEEINTKEDAMLIDKKTVWVLSAQVVSNKNSELNWIDFTVFDEHKKKIGTVSDFFEMQEYDLIEIIIEEKKILIPIHKDLIINLDIENKNVMLTIPEGLLNLLSEK